MGRISYRDRATHESGFLFELDPARAHHLDGNLPGLNGREFDAIFAEIAVICGKFI